jgi:hypothetical protein
MKKFTKLTIALTMALLLIFSVCSCTSAEMVNHNLSQAADNFQVMRKITVYNARTDLIILEMEGAMSLSNSLSSELVVTCMTGPGQYKKYYI